MPQLICKCRTHNPEVAGSNPARANKKSPGQRASGRLPAAKFLPNFLKLDAPQPPAPDCAASLALIRERRGLELHVGSEAYHSDDDCRGSYRRLVASGQGRPWVPI
jgi:hypothetical protein